MVEKRICQITQIERGIQNSNKFNSVDFDRVVELIIPIFLLLYRITQKRRTLREIIGNNSIFHNRDLLYTILLFEFLKYFRNLIIITDELEVFCRILFLRNICNLDERLHFDYYLI